MYDTKNSYVLNAKVSVNEGGGQDCILSLQLHNLALQVVYAIW